MKRATLALAALATATVALAQQTPPTPAEPRTNTTPQEQTAPRMSEADKLRLMNHCMRLVQAARPNLPEKDIKAYCEKKVESYASLR